ncbi:MAG: hypothetical protein IPQ04_11685 [Saprospiraceae bacterium]|nr:hypothetical protein [Saprospiraceae bacterium]
MTATLELYFKGYLFQELEFEWPQFADIAFKERCAMRQWLLEAKVKELKSLYYRQMDKVKDWEIIFATESDKFLRQNLTPDGIG